jgi:hypothetical protein
MMEELAAQPYSLYDDVLKMYIPVIFDVFYQYNKLQLYF